MSRTGNNIASLVFVAVLALFVSQPILNASRSGPPDGGRGNNAAPTTTTQPAEQPTPEEPSTTVASTTTTVPEPEPSATASPSENVATFLGDYPKECLAKVARPNPGLVAALGNEGVTVASPGGTTVARFRATAPIQWSPSGRFLSTGDGEVFSPEGNSGGALFSTSSKKWAWSPSADCAVGIVDGGLEYGGPGGDPGKLIEGDVAGFSFSPNGKKLGYVTFSGGRPSVWAANLRTGSAVEVNGRLESAADATVVGWAGNGTMLYGRSDGTGVDGESLLAAQVEGAARGTVRSLGTTVLKYPGSVKPCRGRTLLVAGGARETTASKRLAYLSKKPNPRFITPEGTAYSSATCSPKLDFIAAIGQADGSDVSARTLTLLHGDGSKVQELTADSFSDDYPLWGPEGTGIIFVRMPQTGGTPQVWYLPEGASARNTGLTLKASNAYYGYFGWSGLLDWSADAPSGMSPVGP